MADLFTAMAGDDVDEAVGDDAAVNPGDEDARVQHTSMYLTRLLFLLFGDDSMPLEYFSSEMHKALLKACDFDWSKISPGVFGSLFQQVKSKEARRSDGEHYTSETNILKTIGPLFLDELRAEADRLIAAKSGSVKKRVGALQEFHERLASMTFCETFMPRWIQTRANYDLAA